MAVVYELGPEAVARMAIVDLETVSAEPKSAIGNFSFHDCAGGVTAFKGRPPWEFHGGGDELLLILAGESELTVIENGDRQVQMLQPGNLVIVPQRRWHSNNAPDGVKMLWITPGEGNEHSWNEPNT